MDYPIKILSQLKPIVQGFRKSAGLTQAAMAQRLGITQQSYAQFEANPALASIERLYMVLRMLDAEIRLVPTSARAGAPELENAVGGFTAKPDTTAVEPVAPARPKVSW